MNRFSIDCECLVGTADIVFGQADMESLCYICGRTWSSKKLYEKIKQNFLKENPSAVSRLTAIKKLPAKLKAIVSEYPQFSGKEKLCEFDSFDFAWLLVEKPEAVQWSNISEFSEPLWKLLLESVPENSQIPLIYDLLHGRNIGAHLPIETKWESYVRWDKVGAGDWLQILVNAPQYAEYCDWDSFKPADWLTILRSKPEFAVHCPWSSFNVSQWLDVFRINPDYADRCDWKKFSSADWVKLLSEFPQFVGQCPWPAIKHGDWVNLFQVDRNYIARCPNWHIFDPADWLKIWELDPSLVQKCPDWGIFKSEDWCEILKKFPAAAAYCDWRSIKTAHWKIILQNDSKNPIAAGKAQTEFNSKFKNNMLEFDQFKHPDYLAVYNYLTGRNIAKTLLAFPAQAKEFLNWDKVGAAELLNVFAAAPRYVSEMEVKHWQSIAKYIQKLSEQYRESVKRLYPAVWAKREEILHYVNADTLQKLTKETYYLIIDFFDWEEFFDFSSMSSAERIDLIIKHPQFGDRYGWDKFTEDEIVNILRIKPDYLPEFHPENFSKKLWQRLIEANEVFASRYNLSFWDYLFYRKFNSRKLAAKITYKWHQWICLATFCWFGYHYLYDGPCGFKSFRAESPLYAMYAALIYVIFAAAWSSIHAKLFAGRTPFLTTLAAAVMGGLLGAVQYGYTYFFTKITLSNKISLGIFGFAFLLLLLIRNGAFGFTGGEITKNRDGFKIIFLIHVSALLLTVLLCHPFCYSQYLKIHEHFLQSSRPFDSARKYYLSKMFYSDQSTLQNVSTLENALKAGDYDTSKQLFESIPRRYMSLELMTGLESRLKDTWDTRQKTFSEKAVVAYKEKNYDPLYAFLSKADKNNAEIQFLLGQCFHFGLGGCKVDFKEAKGWYQKAAAQKNADAMHQLGMLYLAGRGVRQSTAKGVQLLTGAAELGHSGSLRELAFLYSAGSGVKKNKAAACRLFLKAASQNDRISQREAAMILLTGADGIKTDPETAVKLLEKAVEQKDADAQLILGRFYLEGKYVPRNMQKGISLLASAASQNNIQAQTLLGLCFAQGIGVDIDSKTAVSLLEKAANQNNIRAQVSLFEIYYLGKIVSKDIEKAIYWLRKAAENNHPESQHKLALLCWNNAKDYDQAEYWLNKALSNGYSQSEEMLERLKNEKKSHQAKLRLAELRKKTKASLAAAEQSKEFFRKGDYRKALETGLKVTHADTAVFCNLAVIYLKGLGTGKSLRKAAVFANKAAAGNDPRGYYILAWCYDNSKKIKTAFGYYKKAAELGLVEGQYDLGCCYLFGHGCKQNYLSAHHWFLKAAEQNFADAEFNLGYMYLRGDGVEKNRSKAIMWLKRAAAHGSEKAKQTLSALG